jgi:hypothetical protein
LFTHFGLTPEEQAGQSESDKHPHKPFDKHLCPTAASLQFSSEPHAATTAFTPIVGHSTDQKFGQPEVSVVYVTPSKHGLSVATQIPLNQAPLSQ